mgnify:CR=1 FL=1
MRRALQEAQAAFDEGVVERGDLFIMSKVWNDMHRAVAESCRKSIEDLQKVVKDASKSKEPVLWIQGIYPTGKKGYFTVPLEDE